MQCIAGAWMVTLTALTAASPAPTAELAGGRWLELPDTRLADVAPDPLPPGIIGVRGVVDAWSGAVLDSRRQRLLIWGGGHADYAGNEIYAFDLKQRRWSMVWGPTASEQIPDDGKPHETYRDGSPGARHTYDNLVYDPVADALWVAGGSLWHSGSPAAGTWRFRLESGHWEKLADAPAPNIFTQTAYDPVTRLIVRRDNQGVFNYDPDRDKWRTAGKGAWGHWNMNGELDPVARKFVMTGGDRFDIFDVDTRRFSQPEVVGDTRILAAKAPGLAYHPPSGGIVAWSGGSRLFHLTIDDDEYRWTAVEPDNAGQPPGPANPNGTYGRFRYVEALNAFVVVNSVSENVFLYCLGD